MPPRRTTISGYALAQLGQPGGRCATTRPHCGSTRATRWRTPTRRRRSPQLGRDREAAGLRLAIEAGSSGLDKSAGSHRITRCRRRNPMIRVLLLVPPTAERLVVEKDPEVNEATGTLPAARPALHRHLSPGAAAGQGRRQGAGLFCRRLGRRQVREDDHGGRSPGCRPDPLHPRPAERAACAREDQEGRPRLRDGRRRPARHLFRAGGTEPAGDRLRRHGLRRGRVPEARRGPSSAAVRFEEVPGSVSGERLPGRRSQPAKNDLVVLDELPIPDRTLVPFRGIPVPRSVRAR